MSYKDLIPQYGNPREPFDVGVRTSILRPERIRRPDDILWYDKRAADAICEMEHRIECLKDYRRALAARYGELETMLYKDRLEIERTPLYDGHKVYYVRIIRTYEDGSEVTQLHETYQGRQRRDAIARFEALKKAHPGIQTVKDIEKRKWER